jgi:signal transduction histidine kinase
VLVRDDDYVREEGDIVGRTRGSLPGRDFSELGLTDTHRVGRGAVYAAGFVSDSGAASTTLPAAPPEEEIGPTGAEPIREDPVGASLDCERLRRFLEGAASLTISWDEGSILDGVTRLVVPTLGDVCIVYLTPEYGGPARLVITHRNPAEEVALRELYARWAADEATPMSCPDVFRAEAPCLRTDLREASGDGALEFGSYALAPFVSAGARIGAVAVVRSRGANDLGPGDLALVEDLARRAVLAIERGRAYNAMCCERDRLDDISRGKDEFIATISHELRSPLNAIVGWTRMLRRTPLDQDKRARALETVERNANILTHFVDELLDVSRIIAGKLRIELRPVDLFEIVSQALDALRPTAEAKSIALRATLDPGAGPLVGDAGRLQQVVYNLLTNAIKFTPPGGHVDVALGLSGVGVHLRVRDTGCGIRPEVLPHIFERFRQGDAAVGRTYGGLGLGLAIARHIVELHGGAIEATSEGEGRGAQFLVRIPIASVE